MSSSNPDPIPPIVQRLASRAITKLADIQANGGAGITFNATKQRSDAAGRTLRSLDQLDNATVFTYDASGNQLSVRDPNNVGADMVYDQLGRNTSRTDTQGDVTSTYQNFHSTCVLDFEERKELEFEERKELELVFPLAPVLRERGQG